VLRTKKVYEAQEALQNRKPSPLGDARFASLLPHNEWLALPDSIRERFSRGAPNGEATVYVGEIVDVRMTMVGRIFARLAVLVGGPCRSRKTRACQQWFP
jgi:hypothetical protein